MKLQFLSHSAFLITLDSGKTILIDPFLDDNPVAPVKSDMVNADYIILTHGHGDHIGDSFKIAERCKSLFICNHELSNYVIAKGFQAHGMHIGGSHKFDFGKVKLTVAHHGSMTPDNYYAGQPAGIVLSVDGKNIYHTGDTALTYDMKLVGEGFDIDYMMLPIGDNYTMGIDDGVKAVEFVNPKFAIPMHYNTFPLIEADPEIFKRKVEANNKKCIVMKFGEEIEI